MKIILRIIGIIFILMVWLVLLVLFDTEDSGEWNGHYYKIYTEKMNWSEAKKFCESEGGHLVTVETPAENEMLKELIADIETEEGKFWLGGFKNNDNIWKWVTGNNIKDFYLENATPAAKIYLDINQDLEWGITADNVQFPFICEWENVEDVQ
jgi:hypothetical protein